MPGVGNGKKPVSVYPQVQRSPTVDVDIYGGGLVSISVFVLRIAKVSKIKGMSSNSKASK